MLLALSISFLNDSSKVLIDKQTSTLDIFFNRSMSLKINLDFVEMLKKQSHLTNSSNIFLVILYSLSNSL